MFLAVEVFVLFTFFGRPCSAPNSTKRLNYVSTRTFFAIVSSMMLMVVATSSSSYSDSKRISLRFSFPFAWVSFFLAASISFISFLILSLVMAYSGLSDSMYSSSYSSPLCGWTGLLLSSAGLVTCCSVGVLPLWVIGGMIANCSLLVSSAGVSSDTKVLMCSRSS